MDDRSKIAIPFDLTDQISVKRCLSMLRDEIDQLNIKVNKLDLQQIQHLELPQGDTTQALSLIQQKINEIIDAVNTAHTLS